MVHRRMVDRRYGQHRPRRRRRRPPAGPRTAVGVPALSRAVRRRPARPVRSGAVTVALLGPARAFALAERDLAAIRPRLEVMHAEAWWPKQPDRDRPTPHRAATQHLDQVAGST